MAKSLKKRGQKIFDKFSRASIKAGEEGKEHIKENLIGRFSHIKNIKLLVLESKEFKFKTVCKSPSSLKHLFKYFEPSPLIIIA